MTQTMESRSYKAYVLSVSGNTGKSVTGCDVEAQSPLQSLLVQEGKNVFIILETFRVFTVLRNVTLGRNRNSAIFSSKT